MRYRIRFLPLADLDLLEIDANLEKYPVKASRFFETLDKQILRLADMPMIYPVYEDVPAYRKMTVDDYLVFYVVNDETKMIDIHRIINGRMYVAKHLL